MKPTRHSFGVAAGVAASLAMVLAACSPASNDSDDNSTGGSGSGDKTTVTFRLWDEAAAPAYEDSFAEFEKQNEDIEVKVDVVPWSEYWSRIPLDINSGDMADIFLVNSSNVAQYADNGNLIDVSQALGNDHDEWEQSVVDLYTRDGSVWGVPQLWDSIALFYNKDTVADAGVDVEDLTWAPGAGDDDTLLPALQKLTVDADGNTADSAGFDGSDVTTYGLNAQADMQAIYLPWLAENGAQYQDESTDEFAFASEEGVEAFQYVIDLINEYNVAPSAADTNTNGDLARDMFVRGELALFQSGPYSLPAIAEGATEIDWGIVPMIAGPEGRVGTVHGVAAVGNADTDNEDATVEVLDWLGSAEGQAPLAEQGVSFPGAVDAQQAYVDYWDEQGVDVSPFIDAAKGDTARPPVGPAVDAGTNAYTPLLADLFLGTDDLAAGLQEAQDAGNDAME